MTDNKPGWTAAEQLIRDNARPNSSAVILTPNECRAIVFELDRLHAELAEVKAQLEAENPGKRALPSPPCNKKENLEHI